MPCVLACACRTLAIRYCVWAVCVCPRACRVHATRCGQPCGACHALVSQRPRVCHACAVRVPCIANVACLPSVLQCSRQVIAVHLPCVGHVGACVGRAFTARLADALPRCQRCAVRCRRRAIRLPCTCHALPTVCHPIAMRASHTLFAVARLCAAIWPCDSCARAARWWCLLSVCVPRMRRALCHAVAMRLPCGCRAIARGHVHAGDLPCDCARWPCS